MQEGVFVAEESLTDGPFPQGKLIIDLTVDDLICIAEVEDSVVDVAEGEDFDRMAKADALYLREGFPIPEKKVVRGSADGVEVWGGYVEGRAGRVSVRPEKRMTLAALGLIGLSLGASGEALQSLIGSFGYVLAFRRECLALLDVLYVFSRKVAPRIRRAVGGAAGDELFAMSLLMPVVEADLRLEISTLVGATDASSLAGGACFAHVEAEVADKLYEMAEDRGAHVRLDWGPEEPPIRLRDERGAAAEVAGDLSWEVCLEFDFRHPSHINLLELHVVVAYVRWLSVRGIRNKRVLILCDSQVVVGAVSKGRSSSRRVNFLLRKLLGLCLQFHIRLELIWVPTFANPGDCPSRHSDLLEWCAALPGKQRA